jgi:stage II sporulation protein D
LSKNQIELIEGNEKKRLGISPNIFLIRNMEDHYLFIPSLDIYGGEDVRWMENGGEVHLLEVVSSPDTNILDSSSQFHRWQVQISREDLEARVNQYYPVGKLIDIIPRRRGESKRVVELLIQGTEGQVTVTGLKIRWVLGLRDTLFVIEREWDEDGHIKQFVFLGKGWGHGVGLCQVGSYRMALRGASYTTILKKYYQGISIDRLY